LQFGTFSAGKGFRARRSAQTEGMRRLAAFAAALIAVGAANACTGSNSSKAEALHTAAGTPVTSGGYPDWPAYHFNRGRTGAYSAMPAVSRLAVAHRLKLDGAVYASSIAVGGRIIVATENDTVYAFNTAGTLLWRKHLGTPSPAGERPCGNIDPLGITGTPVYYRGYVYVAPEFSGSPPRHELDALHITSGIVAWRKSLDLSGVDATAMQERGALTTEGGRIWVPFGGLAGDCGAYKGRVVGVQWDGQGVRRAYTVPTQREAGIWTPPGPTVDTAGYMYVSVGNGAAGVGDPYDYSDSVLKLDTYAHLRDHFSPSSWASDNDSDLDLGSQGPALVAGKWVFIAGKSGTAYVLHAGALGGIGGQVSSASVCRSFGGTAVLSSTVYVPCTDGVRAVSIDSTGHLHVLWHAASNITGSPVVGGGWVWSLDQNAGVLHALDPKTGVSKHSVSVGTTSRFATPALYGKHVLVPTLTGLTMVSVS
jgi:hypothetical protein